MWTENETTEGHKECNLIEIGPLDTWNATPSSFDTKHIPETEMSKGHRKGRSSRSRSGPVVATRPRKDLIALLPQELVDLIIDNLRDYRSLHSCSLVCRAFVSHTREILFRRINLSFRAVCDKLLLPKCTLDCIKSLHMSRRMLYRIWGGTHSVLNHPAFPQLMTQLGPLRLTLSNLSWQQLNDDARRALSMHAFRHINLGRSVFSSNFSIVHPSLRLWSLRA
ncbi:hypothetical protein ARMGADRAFT_221117 [Armillaria gallica]|uniref:F-box domain-containing protein n=1 Tax=Armillaria gallica TaxID=47427 RepID=A0A2H3ED97_ARMGA|nr:hypothetical protein ARMGADRAFT_221117 [Armillaria gallica]